jgi:hypothetical protein
MLYNQSKCIQKMNIFECILNVNLIYIRFTIIFHSYLIYFKFIIHSLGDIIIHYSFKLNFLFIHL